MARKKHRAFFVCPRWPELAFLQDGPALARALGSDPRTIGRIASQTPVPYATLRSVLAAIRGCRDIRLDVESYIVDTRRGGRS
jgi:hypothetical protein